MTGCKGIILSINAIVLIINAITMINSGTSEKNMEETAQFKIILHVYLAL